MNLKKKTLLVAMTLLMSACFNNQSAQTTQNEAVATETQAIQNSPEMKTYLVSSLSTFPPFILRGGGGKLKALMSMS